jgi:hypothetical protein
MDLVLSALEFPKHVATTKRNYNQNVLIASAYCVNLGISSDATFI